VEGGFDQADQLAVEVLDLGGKAIIKA